MSESTPLLPTNATTYQTSALPSKKEPQDNRPDKLGTFEGVFLPTTLNVLSILMFLRFGFVIGQMGILGSVLLLIMSFTINILTVLSISAISTNGTVKGGGAYYMISRSLGPEFGGAIGIIFFIGQILNASLNVVGLIEPLLVNFGNIQGDIIPLLPVSYSWLVLYSTILLLVCTGITLVGASFVSKTAFWLFVLLVTSTLFIPVSAVFRQPGYPLPEPNCDLWYSGLSLTTLKDNLWPHFTSGAAGSVLPPGQPETFTNLFGIFFPATAGIFAGASMSGDLKNPSLSIPKGTLYGLFVSFILYSLVIISLGASVPRNLLHSDIKIIQSVSLNGIVIILGETATSLFSVIMGIVGAATMLNAIACDKIIPGLSVFSLSKKSPKEKKKATTYAILFTWLIAQVFLFADINSIATFITMAFLTTFFVTNLACFLLRIGSAPNFRPSFKYFNTRTACTGGLVSVLAMYLVDGLSATSVITFLIFLMMVIHYSTPPLHFGDISQLLIYHQVRKYLLRLKVDMSVKYWRPQILLLCDDPRTSWNLIGFCNHLKKGGLYILGHVVLMNEEADNNQHNSGFTIDSVREIKKQKNAWTKVRDIAKIKAFVQIAISPTLPWGVRNVFLGSGLGGMKPNITVLGFYDSQKHGVQLPLREGQSMASTIYLPTDECRKERKVSVNQWVQIVEDLIMMQATVAVAGNFSSMNLPTYKGRKWLKKNQKSSSPQKYIDLYPIQMSSVCLLEDGKSVMSTNFDTYTLILQLGSILSTVDEWELNNYRLRVIAFVESEPELEDEEKRLFDLLSSLRIDAEVHVKCLDDGSLSCYNFLVKGYTVTSENEKEYNRISSILHGDRWWSNLRDARNTLKELERSKSKRRSELKPRVIGEALDKFSNLGLNLSKSYTDSSIANYQKKNRRYTISNLHNQGLSLSFNMRSHGGDEFYKYESDGESSESELDIESTMPLSTKHSSERPNSGTPVATPEKVKATNNASATEPDYRMPSLARFSRSGRKKTPTEHPLMHRYKNQLLAPSSDQVSTKSSSSNLRPNFLAVKIPQSRIRDEEEDDDADGNVDPESKSLIGFVNDDVAENDNPNSRGRSKAADNYSRDASRDGSRYPPSIIANDDINHHIQSPQFLSEDEGDNSPSPIRKSVPSKENEKKVTLRQLQEELANLSFNDIPAKGQHLILNELIKRNSGGGETAVVFSTLPAPVFGTHLNDDESLDFTNSLAIWLDGLPPTVLVNSQTVTVTTAL